VPEGHTGTEKGIDNGGFLAGIKPFDMNADSLLHFRWYIGRS
jgi:hypothetical protein